MAASTPPPEAPSNVPAPVQQASETPGSRFAMNTAASVFADDPTWADAAAPARARQPVPTETDGAQGGVTPTWFAPTSAASQSPSAGTMYPPNAGQNASAAAPEWAFSNVFGGAAPPNNSLATNASIVSAQRFGPGGNPTPPAVAYPQQPGSSQQQQNSATTHTSNTNGSSYHPVPSGATPVYVGSPEVSNLAAQAPHSQTVVSTAPSTTSPGTTHQHHPQHHLPPSHTFSVQTQQRQTNNNQPQQHVHLASGSLHSPSGDGTSGSAAQTPSPVLNESPNGNNGQQSPTTTTTTGGAREGEVQVYTPGFDRVLNLPRAAIRHLPPPNLNVTRLVLCNNYDPKAADPESTCPMRDRCKFVHADATSSREHPIHVNYAWRSLEEVSYERYPPGEPLLIAPPNSKVATEAYEPHTLLKTKALASSRRPLSHCAHYHFNRTCNLGHECRFVHAVFIDPTAKEHQRAPIATIRQQLRQQQQHQQQQHGQQQFVAVMPTAAVGNPQTPSPTFGLPPMGPVQVQSSPPLQQPPQQQRRASFQQMQQSPPGVVGPMSQSHSPQLWQAAGTPTDGAGSLAASRRQSLAGSLPHYPQAAQRRASSGDGSPSDTSPAVFVHAAHVDAQHQRQQFQTLVHAVASNQSPHSAPMFQNHHQQQPQQQPSPFQVAQHQQQAYVQVMTVNGPMLVPASSVVQQQQPAAAATTSFGLFQTFPQQQQQQQLHAHFVPGTPGNPSPSASPAGSPPNASRRASVAISLPPQSPRGQSVTDAPYPQFGASTGVHP
uniref:C3H1-type domain-containing protein n=1 Tax=Neobodo designis TaxID=312471 RepID=A0A6U4VPD9_NEODS